MGHKEKRIMEGLALAALIGTGAGAAGIGPLAGLFEGAGAAGEGAAAATEAANWAATTGEGAAAAAPTGMSAGNEAALMANITGEGATPLGGAAQAQPAMGALGEGGGMPLGNQAAAKTPFDMTKLLTRAGDQATNTAITSAIGQGMQPTVNTRTYAQSPFQGYQPTQPTGMRMSSPEEQLRRLGFS